MALDFKINLPGTTETTNLISTTQEPSTESNEGKVFPGPEPEIETLETVQAEPLDLLKSALTLIIAKAEALDITNDKPKLLGKLKGALEIVNQN